MRSNCLLEAIKAKIKNPSIQIHYIPLCLNRGRLHFYWTDKNEEKFYHYTNPDYNAKNQIWFEGVLKTYDYRDFGGTILLRMKKQNWSFEKQARIARKLGLNWSAKELKEDAEFEEHLNMHS